jgi:hypothetical protein
MGSKPVIVLVHVRRDLGQLIRKTVAESRRVEEKTLGAKVRQVGRMLDNALRRQPQALFQGQGFCGAFRKHCGRLLDLNEVGSHGLDAGRVQIQELFVIHSRATFFLRHDHTMRHPK